MPFLAPFVPALVKGGIGVGASLLGSKLAKSGPSKLEQSALTQAQEAGQQGAAMSENLFDTGMPALRQPMDYWTSLLSGNRGQMTSALGPEIDRIDEGYKTAAETSSALRPRGGPTPDFLAEQPYNQQRDISTLFQQVRPGAAEQLAGTGSNLLANAINAIYGSTAAGRDILGYERERRARDRQSGEQLGRSIFDIFYPANGQPGLGQVLGDIFSKKPAGGS